MAERPDPLAHAWPLLERLADGRPHNGRMLGESLGLTRAAIWKQIDQLRRAGLTVEADAAHGYTLPHPLELLDADRIHAALLPLTAAAVGEISVLQTTPSTNAWLRTRRPGPGGICLAEAQTEGRGRRGRSWYSPLGAGLLLSMSWRYTDPPAAIGSLSLAVGLGCVAALEQCGIAGVGLKWPNDLVHGDATLGGILIELQGEANGPIDLVIGIGINHRLPVGTEAQRPDRDVVDLASLCAGAPPGRNDLAAVLADQLVSTLVRFQTEGFQGFAQAYTQADALAGKRLRVEADGSETVGSHAGVAGDGALLLQTESGVQRIYAGEVSVRATT